MKKWIGKITDVLLLLMFIYFALVQFNDVDSHQWIGIYTVGGLIAIQSLLGYSTRISARIFFVVVLALLILNGHLLTDWLRSGRPDFIDYEPTFIKEAEQMREFLGLVIVLLVSAYYGFMKRKNP